MGLADMNTISFYVYADMPLLSKASSALLGSLDLGIDNAYIPKVDILHVTFKDNVDIDADRTAKNIKAGYEQYGAVNVIVDRLT